MARPSGTVTFLFTDIVGSTRRRAEAVAYARHQIQLAQTDAGLLP